MAKEHSFDISAEIDKQKLKNKTKEDSNLQILQNMN